ncbi:MAG: hypothetical protein KBC84_10330, partial [Proteobacteria bacterium]|nr:hypothetical protein [Pseudomonadota bacterium]
AKSDIYGIGLVFKEIVASLDRSAANDANSLRVMRTLEELANLVLVIDPYKRPSLDIIKAALSNLKSEFNLFHESPTRVSISKGLKVSEFLLQERQNQNLIKSDNVNVRVDIENDKNQNIETVAEMKTEKKQDNKLSSVLVFISGILLFFLWQYRLNSVNEYATIESGDYERYAADWNSKIPSRMLPVALAALNATNPDKSAETVIISASRKDETSISGINNSLIKFAFNDKWEMDLTAQDRRAALFLGLGSLLKNKKIENLPELVDLHPGIILAIISSINNKGESVPQNFQNIPAARLLSLPKIYTQGIRVLLENNQNLNCADKDLQQLIYFMVRGIDIDQLNVFLSNNTNLKLQALNEALSSDENKAQLSLELILRNTLLANIKDESIDWARAFNLLDWKELKATEKLSLLAGRIPKSIISEQNVAKLVTHPALIIRSYAFSLIPTAMKLQHPASLDILQKLQNKPDIISPDQSLQLFRILVNPSKIDPLDIKIWIESTPSIEILESLLLSSAAEIEATPVDTAVAASLKNRAWSPSLDVLRKLSVHPDKFTRMYCYNLIFNLTDKETARELLNIAHNKEKEADYKSQLEEMLSNLSN